MTEPIPAQVWASTELRRALAARDIPTVYRLLIGFGIAQDRIAQLVGSSPSEVGEIVEGRQVHSVPLLERIADGLGVPRGWLGLAYDMFATKPATPELAREEADREAERREFLAWVSSIMFGETIPEQLRNHQLPSEPV